MLRRPELPPLSDLPAFEEDPALFDPSPEWFVRELKVSRRKDEGNSDGLGLRSLIEHPETLSKAWRATRDLSSRRVRRAKGPRPGRSGGWSDAA